MLPPPTETKHKGAEASVQKGSILCCAHARKGEILDDRRNGSQTAASIDHNFVLPKQLDKPDDLD